MKSSDPSQKLTLDEHFRSWRFKQYRPQRDSAEEKELIERVFEVYREHGFPYTNQTPGQIREGFARLESTPSCLQGDDITQSMLGLSIANFFHPEMFGVRCRSFHTPLEVFESDELLRRAIRNRIRYGDNLKPWGIRKAICTMSRSQRVSNFRPSAAKAVYDHFKPKLALDFSAGWGGRLLGAMASGTPYVGIDPHGKALEGNERMVAAVQAATRQSFAVELVHACAEDVLGQRRWCPDLVFTSPPYFDVEKYSGESTQSYLRYPDLRQWYDEFLGQCIRGSFHDLLDGGHLCLNVNPDMVEETKRLALEAGFVQVAHWNLLLSRHQFSKKALGDYRTEPVLVFQKQVGGVGFLTEGVSVPEPARGEFKMKIQVPNNIAAAALGGNTTVLAKVAEAYTALREAQAEAEAAFLPDIAQVLAVGLAAQHGSMAGAEMKIEPDGSVVVYVGEDTEDMPNPAPKPDPKPDPAPEAAPNGKLPPIGELRSRAEAAGVDISDLDGRNQKDEMLARIEAAESTPAEPEEVAAIVEPEPEVEVASEPEVVSEPEDEPVSEDDGLGLDDGPDDDDLVESPENEEGVPPVSPPSDEELDVDDWLE